MMNHYRPLETMYRISFRDQLRGLAKRQFRCSDRGERGDAGKPRRTGAAAEAKHTHGPNKKKKLRTIGIVKKNGRWIASAAGQRGGG